MSKSEKLSSCHILMGPEIGEKQTALETLEKQFGGGTGNSPSLEKTVYYAGETPVSTIVSDIRNGSLFAAKRLFIIKNADQIGKKEDLELMASCMASPGDDTLLVLLSDETKISKTLENAAASNSKKIFYELFESQKQKWVEDFFKREGFRIGQDGIDTILEMTENNTAALKQECSRLCLFVEKGKEISSEIIEKWLSHTREESAFMLFSRIAAGDFSRSLESLKSLLDAKETPQSILAVLAWCFRKLYDYLMLKKAGVQNDFEYKKIGISSPQAKRDYAGASRFFNLEKTESCLALTAEYDAIIRQTTGFPGELLMSEYLYKIKKTGGQL